jgi:hypothetical protein
MILSVDFGGSYDSTLSPVDKGEPPFQQQQQQQRLSMSSTLNEILDAMKSSHSGGLKFFNNVTGLPPLTFIGKKTNFEIH